MNPPFSRTLAVQAQHNWPLHNTASTRKIEHELQAQLPHHTLMQRAGLASAQLALAVAPHAQTIWIACGPGNNGGDGLEAALQLKQMGKNVAVTYLGDPAHAPADAKVAYQRAVAAGMRFESSPPAQFDLAIDALLGIACHSPPTGQMAHCLDLINQFSGPVVCLDLPSGLLADTGQWLYKPSHALAQERHTLSFLTLKPGLFTADGRDAAGRVWFNTLVAERTTNEPEQAVLQGATKLSSRHLQHNTHKGNFGDVHLIGGANGMVGAAVLAANAALQSGAGRVYVGLLDEQAQTSISASHPCLMVRAWRDLPRHADAVVCGCGGGSQIAQALGVLLGQSQRLVLDADALNALSADAQLQTLLAHRVGKQYATVLTPHPLEAARLLGCSTVEIQSNRLFHAQSLADKMQCVVVLKGSGSVVAAPNAIPVINPTGNALLSTAGTGDVLAGLIGARLAQGQEAMQAACSAVFDHGLRADQWLAQRLNDPQGSGFGGFDAAQLAASLRFIA